MIGAGGDQNACDSDTYSLGKEHAIPAEKIAKVAPGDLFQPFVVILGETSKVVREILVKSFSFPTFAPIQIQ